MSPFSLALRNLRFQLGLRQHDLSELTGCDRGYVSALETGLKPAPSSAFVDNLIAALELSQVQAEELHHARARSRRTYSVAPDSSAEIYDFVYSLFTQLDRLSATQVHALRAVLQIGDVNGDQVCPARRLPTLRQAASRDESMEEAM